MSSAAEEGPAAFPERVGRYELLLPIGTGGMATVYLGRIQVVGDVYREVALKLMHPFIHAEGKESGINLIEEAKLAVRIRHPNVIPVVEVGEGPHGVFLVMEYVEGDTLSAINRAMRHEGRAVPWPIAARILNDALAGLHAAHELKDDLGQPFHLVHRDFSPQNILVGTDGVSRLTDFGIAKAAGRLGVTSSGIIKGKVSYMAPEQALGKRVDRRCDIWAAGVVAWELLSGQRLYKQEDQVATLLKIVSEHPPRLREVRADIPQVLDDLVADALSVDVDKRIPTAMEMRRRLAEAWKQTTGIAEPAEVGEFAGQVALTKLSARREQVSRVLRLRARIALVGESAARASMQLDSSPQGSDETTSAISASSLSKPSEVAGIHAAPLLAARPRAGKRWGVVAAVVGGGLTLGTALLIWTLSGTRAETPVDTAAAAAAAPAKPEPAKSAAPAVSKKPVSRKVSIRSETPLVFLSIDGVEQKLEAGSKQLELELPADTSERALPVRAEAKDGRKLSSELGEKDSELELIFPASRAVREPVGSPRPSRKEVRDSPKSDQPGLAPTPYDK
jgi:serine/threonine-protein kinase